MDESSSDGDLLAGDCDSHAYESPDHSDKTAD